MVESKNRANATILIEGKKNVRSYLRKTIRNVEKELFEYIKGVETEFSTRILSEIFDIIPRRIRESPKLQTRQRRLKDLHETIMVLDTLIENKMLKPFLPERVNTKEVVPLPRNPSSEFAANCAFHTFRQQISEPRTVLLQCDIANIYRVHLDRFGTPHFGTENNKRAIDDWMAHRASNEDWERYFEELHPLTSYSEEHDPAFMKRYGFDVTHIAMLEKRLNERAERRGTSYTTIRERDIIRNTLVNLPHDQLDSLLDYLVYQPGRNFGMCMYVPLSERSRFDYVFGKPAVSLTAGSLKEYITRGGSMMTDYGEAFNDYVTTLIQNRTSLHVVEREVKFWKQRRKKSVAQMKKGDEIKVDIIATEGEYVYVISCKAHGYMWELGLESNLMFVPSSDFYSRTRNNLKDIREVIAWMDVIRKSSKRLDEVGVKGKNIKPMLITSECEPLQLKSVRDWFQSEVEPVPACEQYSISNLESIFPVPDS